MAKRRKSLAARKKTARKVAAAYGGVNTLAGKHLSGSTAGAVQAGIFGATAAYGVTRGVQRARYGKASKTRSPGKKLVARQVGKKKPLTAKQRQQRRNAARGRRRR
jgi:hypothetical protein